MITEEKLEQLHKNVCPNCKNKGTDKCEIVERIDGTLNCVNEETE